jgi:glutathione peroxidase
MTQLHNFQAKTISGQDFLMEGLQGKAVLVVNTASACGFTPQLAGLQALHEEFGPQGLVVLGFPCNQFGSQDPGSNEEIGAFCQANYGVTFTMMDKVEVNGAQAHPLFQWLKTQAPGLLGSEGIKWNFTKFLLNRQGDVVKRYAPLDKPASLAQDIAEVLKQS